MTRLGTFSGIVVAALAAAPVARAQNYRSVPIGGRTATMGGAGTASGIDSAMPYLNPAGLGGLPGDVLAVSASLVGYQYTVSDDLFRPNGVNAAYQPFRIREERSGSRVLLELPSAVFYGKHLSPPGSDAHHFIAFSLITPLTRRVRLASSASVVDGAGREATESLRLQHDVTDYYIGPTWAVELGRRVRIGVSAYALYTQERFFSSDQSESVDRTIVSTSRGSGSRAAEALSFAPIAGVQAEVVPWLWLGAAAQAPSVHVTGSIEATGTLRAITPTTNGSVSLEQAFYTAGERRFDRPLRLNAGLAYDRPGAVSFAADLHYYSAHKFTGLDGATEIRSTSSNDTPRRVGLPAQQDTELESVVNVAVGLELPTGEDSTLRFGAFTDFDAAPALEARQANALQVHEDRFGGTVGVGLKGSSFESTIGLVYTFGNGEVVVADRYGSSPDEFIRQAFVLGEIPTAIAGYQTHTIALVLSGSITTEQAKRTIEETSPLNQRRVPGPEVPFP